MNEQRHIPLTKRIVLFLHCGLCMEELKKIHEAGDDTSPEEYQRTQTGMTDLGIQTWCLRHDCNIMHVDFEGQKHPANTRRKKLPEEFRKGFKSIKGGK